MTGHDVGGRWQPTPAWVEAPPAPDDETFYALGISSPQASRRAAYDDALRHALKQFLLYAGAETAQYAQYATRELGLDVASSSTERIAVTTQAFVRHFRVQRTHYRHVTSEGGGPTRVEAYVLAAIPQAELSRVETSIRDSRERER